MQKFDVVVIGGGIVGSAIARELSKYALHVALIEKEEEVSFGVSKANSGIVHAGFHAPLNTLKGKLCARGNFLYDELKKDLDIPFKRVGELVVINKEEDFAKLEEFKKQGEELKVPGLKILNQDEVRDLEPHIASEIVGALFAPSAGVVNPYEFVYLLAENARLNGVIIKTGEEVVAIHEGVIKTTKDEYQTRYIINAAGLYGDRIASMVGLDYFKIKPRKGEEYLIDKKCEGLVKRVIFPLPDEKSKGTLIIPTLDGTIMVGPSAEDVQDKRDLKTTDDICWEIFQKAKSMVPKLDMFKLISAFSGLRPVAYGPKGDDFIIEKTSVKGFINAAGIQSPGLTAAPAIAEMVIDILKDDGLALKKKDHFIPHNKPVYKLREISKEKLIDLHKEDPDWGTVVCRCEMVSMAEIKNAVHMGAKTLDGVKFRTRAGMGRCQGGFCTFKTIEIMAHELKLSPLSITKKGPGSEILLEDRGLKNDK